MGRFIVFPLSLGMSLMVFADPSVVLIDRTVVSVDPTEISVNPTH